MRPGSGSWGQYAGDLFAVRKRKMVPHSVDSQSLLPRVITVSMHDPTAKLGKQSFRREMGAMDWTEGVGEGLATPPGPDQENRINHNLFKNILA